MPLIGCMHFTAAISCAHYELMTACKVKHRRYLIFDELTMTAAANCAKKHEKCKNPPCKARKAARSAAKVVITIFLTTFCCIPINKSTSSHDLDVYLNFEY